MSPSIATSDRTGRRVFLVTFTVSIVLIGFYLNWNFGSHTIWRSALNGRGVPDRPRSARALASLQRSLDTPEQLVVPSASPSMATLKQRPPGEWTGMLVDLSVTPPCLDGAFCGLARACIDSSCTACTSDSSCLENEGCVLDHCVRLERIMCRSRGDCLKDEACILSGYSPDPRGNREMSALCISLFGGSGTDKPEAAPAIDVPMPAISNASPFDENRARAYSAYSR